MKKILFLATLFLASIAANAQNNKTELNIYNLNFGTNQPFEDGSVTFTSAWEMAGWSFQDEDGAPTGVLAGATDFILEVEPAEFAFQIKVQYLGGTDDTDPSVTVPANTSLVRVALEASTSKDILSISIQDRNSYAGYPDCLGCTEATYDGARGTVFLTSATIEFNAKSTVTYYQFEGDQVGKVFPSVDLKQTNGIFDMVEGPVQGLVPSVATVAAGGNSGNAIEVYPENYNQAIRLYITLPTGATVANIESVKFDLAFPEATGDFYKQVFVSLYDKASGVITLNPVDYPKIATGGGSWTTNTIPVTSKMKENLENLTAFDLFLGVNTSAADIENDDNLEGSPLYKIDNVALVIGGDDGYVSPVEEPALSGVAYVNAESGVVVYTTANGIFVESNGEKTTVFGVDGRVVTSTFDSNISLQGGLYIVKVGDAPAAKVIVK